MDTKLSVKQIEDAIVRTFCDQRGDIIIPNLSWGLLPYEIDLAVIKPNGYMTEYEIKRSYSDLVADFKKAIYHNDERVKRFHYVLPVSIKDKAIALFDEHKEDENYKAVFGFRYPSCLFYDESAQFVSHTSFDMPAKMFRRGSRGGSVPDMRTIEKIHPTHKPVELYAYLLKIFAKEGNTIFDPMMGSQSSRIAAYKMGFDYVGCELDKGYFDKGCERFDRECKHITRIGGGKIVTQLTFFDS